MRSRFRFITLFTVWLTACAGTAPFRAIDLPVPARYPAGGVIPAEPHHAARPVVDARVTANDDPPWSQQFADPRLDRLVTRILAVNTDRAAAGLRLRRARLVAGLGDLNGSPRLDGALAGNLSRPLDDHASSTRSNSARVSVSYEIDLWGKLQAARDVAHWQARASVEDLHATTMLLIAESCSIYWTLAVLNQRIALGRDSLARSERTLRLVQAQFDAGAVSRVELREADQRLHSERAAQSQLQQQRVVARNAITVLLDGAPWPAPDEPMDLDAAQSAAPDAGIPAQLLGRRPDLRAAALRLQAAHAGVTFARTSAYPALSLTGSLGSSSDSLQAVLRNPVAALGVGLTLPFLRWQEVKLDTAIATADYAIAVNEFRGLLYRALAEVDNALSARIEIAAQVEQLALSRLAAIDVERLYEVRYRAGATPLRTWLDAQETRRNAELAHSEARLRLLQNDATLFQALGGHAR